MRPLLTSFAAALAISLMATSSAHAQSSEEPAKQETAPKKEELELTADQKELDKRLLGAWAAVTDDIDTAITDELFLKAVESCGTVPQAIQLDAEPGLKKALPDRRQVRGELIYFRTDQGLQRYQTKPSAVFLLPDIEKAVNARGQTVWQVSGQFARFSIAFADAPQGANTLLMLEEDKLYLKCESPPQTDG